MSSLHIQTFVQILERDINKLELEIKSYADDKSLWVLQGEIKNTAGSLCLHLCGNLQHYIGTRLGNTGYIRDRDQEFSARDVPKATLLMEIQKTRKAVLDSLHKLRVDDLDKIYPEEVLGYPMTTSFFLTHLAGHLNYHLGQINYHRRMIR
jgi:uncharacterized damage-inducible protein DinB